MRPRGLHPLLAFMAGLTTFHFADDGGGAGGGGGGDKPEGDKPEDKPEGDKPEGDKPEADAKLEMTQTDLDKLIEKRLGQARKSWEKDQQTAAERDKLEGKEKAEAEKADAERQRDEAKAELLLGKIETAAERAALVAGVKPERVGQFMRLVELDADDHATDGKPDADAIKAAVDKALEGVPEFKGEAVKPADGNSGGDGLNGDGAKTQWTREKIAGLSVEEYEKHKDEILEQTRAGTVK